MTLALLYVVCMLLYGAHALYFPLSTKLEQCCATPVESFIMREFSGPCSCQTLKQQWRRYVDWIEINGGFVHPWIEFGYVSDFKHNDDDDDDDDEFSMYSHERGTFINIQEKYKTKLAAKTVLFEIPFHTTFSELLIAKYIRNATRSLSLLHHPEVRQHLFGEADHYLPDAFPDAETFRRRTISRYRSNSIRGWLALGLAWLKENTRELLPWIALLPTPSYLPISWPKLERDQSLLKGTQALQVVHTMEREFEAAKPYLAMLNLTEEQVKQSFAWVTSRSFGMDFSSIGGQQRSPAIPCGADFPNHDVLKESSLHYDSSFGTDRYVRHSSGQTNHEVISSLVSRSRGEGSNATALDFMSNFLWVSYPMYNGSEVVINYGKHHTSASRMALFGFIDDVHPYDNYAIRVDIPSHDPNYAFKRKYFQTVWNSTWIAQRNQHIFEWHNNICFYKPDDDEMSWQLLGQRRILYEKRLPYSQQQQQQQKLRTAAEMPYAPPVSMEYFGQRVVKAHASFFHFVRLTFLPAQYFDSFTISAILNDHEMAYIEDVIDPLVTAGLHSVCRKHLWRFPTTYFQDQIESKKVEQERYHMLQQMRRMSHKNMTADKELQETLSSLDRLAMVLKYRLREKSFLNQCMTLQFEPSAQYARQINRSRRVGQRHEHTSTQIATSASSTQEDTLQTLLDNIDLTEYVSETDDMDVIEVNYDELLRQIESVLGADALDDELWAQLIEHAVESLVGGEDDGSFQYECGGSDDSIFLLVDELNAEEEQTTVPMVHEASSSASAFVSKHELVIGEPRKSKQVLAQTLGWNSPRAGVAGNTQSVVQNFEINLADTNGQQLDLSSLFGGGGGSNGNVVYINNANNMNQGLAALLNQFGLNLGGQSAQNGQTANNAGNAAAIQDGAQVQRKQDIPDMIPFSQIMGGATTVTVMGMNGAANVGNLNLNDLTSLFNGARKKKP